jgi:2-desacetyl-2-hydroxyethyl bacteriochlorophyllide A dehydrogenase
MTQERSGQQNPAVVFTAPGEVALRDVPVGEPGPGEVLLRTRRTLISTGTELTILSGKFPADSAWGRYGRFPFLAGYSAVGEVAAVGAGVHRVKVGDLVAASTPHARYAAASADSLVPASEAADLLDFLPFCTLGQTAMNGVRRSGAGLGDVVVIFGLGIVGQLAMRLCYLAGARPVIGVDVAGLRLAAVPDCAGVTAIDASAGNVASRVAELTGGRMADIVFEVTGEPELIPGEFAMLKPRDGRFVLLSSPRGPTSIDFHDLCNSPSHTIIGAHTTSHPAVETAGSQWTLARNGELFVRLLAGGELGLEPLVTHRLPAAEACSAYEMLVADRSQALGVVLDWD